MGYFSNVMCDRKPPYGDHSITEPKQQLLWRVEELQARLDVLEAQGAPYSSGLNYGAEDYRYALSGEFHTIFDTERALDAALEELKWAYGIDLYPKSAELPIQDEITENQITFWMLLPRAPHPTAA